MHRIDEDRVLPRMSRRRLMAAACAALFAIHLGGCSGLSEMSVSSQLVTRGKYDVYSCPDIEANLVSRRSRAAELEKLMAQASQGTGGGLVNAIAYRSDYAQARGEIDELARAANAKQCKTQSEWSSVRAIN